MICIKTQHFSLNRLLLLAVGLWPYHQTIFVRFQLFLFFSILTSFVLFQFTVLITERNNALIFKVISSILFFIIFVIKYHSFWNVQNVKVIMDHVQHSCNELKDKNEIAIIRKYGNYAKLSTVGLTLIAICCLFAFICVPFWPYIIDVFLSVNVSRPQMSVYIMTEYFIDKERYFYLLLWHMDMATSIGVFALVATGTTLIGYVEHACGMFRIASYRIEHAMTIENLQNIRLENKKLIYNKIILAIDMHRKAIKSCELIMCYFEKSYLILVSILVSCLSFNLFRIFQILSFEDDMSEIIIHFMNAAGALLFIFIINYEGQEITEHNSFFFVTVYNVQWYTAPLPIQRMILFLLKKGNKTFQLNVAGIFSASLECFASLTSASVSYFTVMYSTQQ